MSGDPMEPLYERTAVGKWMTALTLADGYMLFDKHKKMMATIRWHAPWRSYVAKFNGTEIMSSECLRDLAAFLDSAKERR